MSKEELANWQKIKDYFEKLEKTDNYFYKRAVAICKGEPDPIEPLK
tara:strand:+ start:373 stop:510 length:138 start_codon:yes stop_codon:yes gene_type:complete